MRTITTLAIAAIISSAALAQPAPPPPSTTGWCGTSNARTEILRERHEWRQKQPRPRSVSAEHARVLERDGIFIVEGDDSTLVNEHVLDLVGTTLRLEPEGEGYRVESRPLAYRDDLGDLVADFSDAELTRAIVDLPFTFPFFGNEYTTANLTNRNGLFFSTPSTRTVTQFEVLDAAAIEQPAISPLLFGSVPRTFVSPKLFMRSDANEVVVTWQTDSADFAYDVQAVLANDGAIELSWRSARNVDWGAVVVTPGLGESGMSRSTIVALDDPEFDASGERADQDLERIELTRIGDTDLVEVRFKFRGIVRQRTIAEGEYVQYGLDSSSSNSSRIAVHLTPDGQWILLPGRGWISDPGSLSIEGDTVRFLVRDRDLQAGPEVTLSVWVWDSASQATTDNAYGSLAHVYSDETFDLDLSASTSTYVDRAIVESFTLADMDPYAVWDLLSREYGIDPEETDALPIYQNFFTDLVLYAGAYSTVGNPGVDGVSDRGGYGTEQPRFPALLHMSKLGYRYNTTDESSIHVLNHEFGHRWLYFFEILEDGESQHSLNPAGGHPAQFVHTPAAFDVLGDRNSSAMGGSWFDDLGNGTFRARESLASYGYSWHELYLMGLADPDEVEPWYYIRNSNPKLGDAYYPPDGIVVSGSRKDVTIDQLIGAMGPRDPETRRSRKRFTAYFVVLVRDLDEVTEEEIAELDHHRRLLRGSIPAATGGRANVATVHDEDLPRRRGIRRP